MSFCTHTLHIHSNDNFIQSKLFFFVYQTTLGPKQSNGISFDDDIDVEFVGLKAAAEDVEFVGLKAAAEEEDVQYVCANPPLTQPGEPGYSPAPKYGTAPYAGNRAVRNRLVSGPVEETAFERESRINVEFWKKVAKRDPLYHLRTNFDPDWGTLPPLPRSTKRKKRTTKKG